MRVPILQYIRSFVFVFLVFLGIAGMVYKFFSPGGWMEQWFNSLIGSNAMPALGLLILVIAIAVLSQRWSGADAGKGLSGNILAYFWLAAGLYFGVRLAMTGGF